MDAKIFAAVFSALALILAGCIVQNVSISNGTLAIEVPDNFTGTVATPAANASATPANASNATLQILPDSINVCIVGDKSAAGAGYENVLAENLTLVEFNKSIALVPKWLDDSSSRAEFTGCGVIIAKDDGVGVICSRVARDAIKLQVQSRRAGFILTQSACSLADDPAVQGWDLSWKGFVPLKMDCPHNDPCTLGNAIVENAKFVIDDPYDPAVGDAKNFNLTSINVTDTNQDENGRIVAFLRTNPTKTTEVAYAAVVRKKTILPTEGYTYYFAFDPLQTPSILRRVIELLAKRNVLLAA